ncbi:MAG TPA: hypothetical protein VLM76_15135 [Patescibacteria group bacterium]|nr:hypothetical protein [Patescibacteria group bacterium]
MDEINPGDIVRVTTTPGFTNAAGVLTDPTTVRFRWRAPDGRETTWTHGIGTEVVKLGIGLYEAHVPVTLPGLHFVRWEGTGPVTAAAEGTFSVVTHF